MKKTSPSLILGAFLKDRREKAKLTQKQVAEHLDYTTPQFISSWERGDREPPINVIWRLASLYKISAEKIFDVMLEYRQATLEKELREQFLAQKPKKKNV